MPVRLIGRTLTDRISLPGSVLPESLRRSSPRQSLRLPPFRSFIRSEDTGYVLRPARLLPTWGSCRFFQTESAKSLCSVTGRDDGVDRTHVEDKQGSDHSRTDTSEWSGGFGCSLEHGPCRGMGLAEMDRLHRKVRFAPRIRQQRKCLQGSQCIKGMIASHRRHNQLLNCASR